MQIKLDLVRSVTGSFSTVDANGVWDDIFCNEILYLLGLSKSTTSFTLMANEIDRDVCGPVRGAIVGIERDRICFKKYWSSLLLHGLKNEIRKLNLKEGEKKYFFLSAMNVQVAEEQAVEQPRTEPVRLQEIPVAQTNLQPARDSRGRFIKAGGVPNGTLTVIGNLKAGDYFVGRWDSASRDAVYLVLDPQLKWNGQIQRINTNGSGYLSWVDANAPIMKVERPNWA